jgi:hypothetical protein
MRRRPLRRERCITVEERRKSAGRLWVRCTVVRAGSAA